MILQNHFLNILVVLFSAGGCYFNTLNGMFVFDDTEAVLKNPDLNVNNSLSNIFYNDFWGTHITSNNSHKSYRPLTVLLYRIIIYNAGSKNPFYFHLINIMLYVSVCITLYILLSTILIKSKRNVAFSTTILFSVHPVHSEVVCSIVGLADLLCAFTFFLALLFYNKSVVNSSIIYYCITLILSVISMFCKETGITILGVCCLYDSLIILTNSKKYSYRNYLIRQVGLVITILSLLYLRWKIMNFTQPTFQPVDNPASFAENYLTRVLSYNYIYLLNVLLLLWPQWLCFDWSMGCISLLEHFLDIRFMPVILFWILTIIFVSIQLKRRAKVPLVAFIIFVVTFLPASNLWLRVGFVIAERTLFLPSAGFCLLVCCGFHRICQTFSKYKQLLRGCFIVLCVLFMTRTWQRSKEWLNEYDLFTSALTVCPNNAKVHYNIAKVAADMNDTRLSESEYRKALQLYPKYGQAMNNLANLLRDLGQLEEAKQLLTKAVNLRPDFAAAWMNLGIVLATLDQNEEAEMAYLTALKHRRNCSDCFYNLGNLYLKIHRNEEALHVWERAVILNPLHSAAWSNTLVLLDGMGLHEKVLEVGQDALNKCSTSAAIHFTLGNTFGKLKRWQEAEHHFQKAIELNRQNALYYSNFGVLYHRWGKLDKAVQFYEQALRLDPHLTSAVNNLKRIK